MWCVMLVPHALLYNWSQLQVPLPRGLTVCVITKICEWIGPTNSPNFYAQVYELKEWWWLFSTKDITTYT